MAQVPRRLPGEPKCSLTPAELHLLECVDGTFDVEELAFTSGRPLEEVESMLSKLVAASAISFEPEKVGTEESDAPPASDVEVELPLELQAQIDELCARIQGANHYEVLGLARTATKEQIRDAYYKVGPRFHPDRHFRKKLGPYKARIEAVFAAFTKAHDTLRFEAKRAAYDASLVAPSAPSAPIAAPSVRAIPTTPPSGSAAPASSRTTDSEAERKARRDALARKLGQADGSMRPASSIPTASRPPLDSAPPPNSERGSVPSYRPVEGVQKSAAEMLRARFDQVATDVKERRIRQYLESAEDAMNLGDFRTAVAALEQASRLDPEDQDIRQKRDQARKLAGST